MNTKSLIRLTLALASLVLTACSTVQSGGADVHRGPAFSASILPNQKHADVPSNPARRTMQSGVDAIVAGDAKRANHVFTLALAHDLKSPGLHAANALAYQLRTRAGERDMFILAETGYLIALEQRHDFQSAALQLTRLYLENKRYQQAQRAAAYVLGLDASNIEALYLLSSASYYLGDVDLALWAIEHARDLAPLDKLGARMIPAIYGAAGLTKEAEAFIEQRQVEFGKQDSDKLKQRVSQWKSVYESASIRTQGDTAGKPLQKNQTAAYTAKSPSSIEVKPEDQGALVYSWSDCAQQLIVDHAGGAQENNGQLASGQIQVDETTMMPSLPSPCRGRAMPQMAIIDVVMLRTNEVSTSSQGINLLQNLAVTIQQSSNRVSTTGTNVAPTVTSTLTTNYGLGTSAGSAIAYSLNIANAMGQTTEVIARPSLLVLDRQPAQFFSGSNVSIGLAGAVGSASTMSQVNIGVSLSVTPTFVDDNQILLNVKAARSFFEPTTASSTFTQSMQTSRNMVSAATIARVNETLVLSGLTEHEVVKGSSGVPVLKDIPGLKYFFSTDTTASYDKTVLILITPRRIMPNGETLEALNEPQKSEKREPRILQEIRERALKDIGTRWLNLRHIERGDLAFGVRANDIEIEDWNRPPRIQQILQDATESLY